MGGGARPVRLLGGRLVVSARLGGGGEKKKAAGRRVKLLPSMSNFVPNIVSFSIHMR